MDIEKRRRLENVLRHLLALVENQFWGSMQVQLRAGLIVNVREERTFDPATSMTRPRPGEDR